MFDKREYIEELNHIKASKEQIVRIQSKMKDEIKETHSEKRRQPLKLRVAGLAFVVLIGIVLLNVDSLATVAKSLYTKWVMNIDGEEITVVSLKPIKIDTSNIKSDENNQKVYMEQEDGSRLESNGSEFEGAIIKDYDSVSKMEMEFQINIIGSKLLIPKSNDFRASIYYSDKYKNAEITIGDFAVEGGRALLEVKFVTEGYEGESGGKGFDEGFEYEGKYISEKSGITADLISLNDANHNIAVFTNNNLYYALYTDVSFDKMKEIIDSFE